MGGRHVRMHARTHIRMRTTFIRNGAVTSHIATEKFLIRTEEEQRECVKAGSFNQTARLVGSKALLTEFMYLSASIGRRRRWIYLIVSLHMRRIAISIVDTCKNKLIKFWIYWTTPANWFSHDKLVNQKLIFFLYTNKKGNVQFINFAGKKIFSAFLNQMILVIYQGIKNNISLIA